MLKNKNPKLFSYFPLCFLSLVALSSSAQKVAALALQQVKHSSRHFSSCTSSLSLSALPLSLSLLPAELRLALFDRAELLSQLCQTRRHE